jgi:hypothetical protein
MDAVELWDVEAPTFSGQLATYGGANLTREPPWRFLVLISVRAWINPRAKNAAGEIRSIEKSVDLIGNWTHTLHNYYLLMVIDAQADAGIIPLFGPWQLPSTTFLIYYSVISYDSALFSLSF